MLLLWSYIAKLENEYTNLSLKNAKLQFLPICLLAFCCQYFYDNQRNLKMFSQTARLRLEAVEVSFATLYNNNHSLGILRQHPILS